MTTDMAIGLIGYLVAGAVVGLVFFASLLRSTESLASGGNIARIIALYIFRVVLVCGAGWLAVQQGALPLLAGLAGFVLARLVAKRRVEGSA